MRIKTALAELPVAAAVGTVAAVVATLAWWRVAAGGRPHAISGFVAITAFSFSLGGLLGFFIGSTEEEKEGVGKIRDVLVGGVTGAALVSLNGKADEAYRFLEQFAPTVADSHARVDVASVIGMATAYSVAGFILGYLNREFWLNPPYAIFVAWRHSQRKMMRRSLPAIPSRLPERRLPLPTNSRSLLQQRQKKSPRSLRTGHSRRRRFRHQLWCRPRRRCIAAENMMKPSGTTGRRPTRFRMTLTRGSGWLRHSAGAANTVKQFLCCAA